MNKYRKNHLKAARAAGYVLPKDQPKRVTIDPDKVYGITGVELQLLQEGLAWVKPQTGFDLGGRTCEHYRGLDPTKHKLVHAALGQTIARILTRNNRLAEAEAMLKGGK